MKKTLTAIVATVMAFAMGTTSFAAASLPDVLPDATTGIFDAILNVFDVILGLVGTLAGMLFK